MVFARRFFSATVLILLGMLVSSAWTDGTNPEPRNNPVNPEEMARAIQQWLTKNPPMQAYSHAGTQHVLAVSTKSEGPQINITSRYGINIKLECKAKGPVIAAVDQLNDRAVEINLFSLAEHMGVKPKSCAEYAAVDKTDRELGKITPPWQYQRAQLERSFEETERAQAQEEPQESTPESAPKPSETPSAPSAKQVPAPPLSTTTASPTNRRSRHGLCRHCDGREEDTPFGADSPSDDRSWRSRHHGPPLGCPRATAVRHGQGKQPPRPIRSF